MKQFTIIAYDYQDAEALGRRMNVRAQHFEDLQVYKSNNNFIKGGAILGDDQKMIGSVLIVQFESREALDAYLAQEVYITAKVWERVQVIPMKIAEL